MLAHIPCKKYNYWPKAICLAIMARRVLEATKDPTKINDKDYYGNKRLESAGPLIALIFEDKFKLFNSETKKEIVKKLNEYKNKPNPDSYDLTKEIKNQDIITSGLANALSSGNWNIKRFNMNR